MLFNSWEFAGFLALVVTAYYACSLVGLRWRAQIGLLFLASLVFYAYETPSLLLLLLGSLLVNAFIAQRLAFNRSRRALLIAGIAFNLLLLAFFKYAGLIVSTVLPASLDTQFVANLQSIPLPIGISFYTFQAISLLVDLSREDSDAIRDLRHQLNNEALWQGKLRIGFYIAFFPQLVAGPIVKASFFFGQIGDKLLRSVKWDYVLGCLICGFFLKMVVADNLKDVTGLLNSIHLGSLGKLDLVILLYGYSFQIFADFAGYSLIAIGLGALFGYRFPINFNYPYISRSITEFWQRWHISLSSFLRQYLYIPLGGNRRGRRRTYINLALVMILGGLWHGAAWSYAIWGAAHGVFLALERFISSRALVRTLAHTSAHTSARLSSRSAARSSDHVKASGVVAQGLRILVTFHLVSILWLLFLMPDFQQVILYFRTLFGTKTLLLSIQNVYVVLLFATPIVLYHADALWRESVPAGSYVTRWRPRLKIICLATMLFLIVVNSGSSGEFIYFQF